MQGNFAQAGQSLSGGFTGSNVTGQAGQMATQGVAQEAAAQGAQQGLLGGVQQGIPFAEAVPAQGASLFSPVGGPEAFAPIQSAAPEAAKKGLLSRALGAAADSPYTMPTAMITGGNMLSNTFERRAQERDARREEEEYNRNIGTRLWN